MIVLVVVVVIHAGCLVEMILVMVKLLVECLSEVDRRMAGRVRKSGAECGEGVVKHRPQLNTSSLERTWVLE